MPDTEDDLKKLTTGEATAIVSARTALETRVDDAPEDLKQPLSDPEDPYFGPWLAMRLSDPNRQFLRIFPSLRPHRALNEDEARVWAEGLLCSELQAPEFSARHRLDATMVRLWRRLPACTDAKVALSYQRMIHQLTRLLAWMEWQTGSQTIKDIRALAAMQRAESAEEEALAPWVRSIGAPADAAAHTRPASSSPAPALTGESEPLPPQGQP